MRTNETKLGKKRRHEHDALSVYTRMSFCYYESVNFIMANSFRRSSSALIPTVTSHCHRCQLDIESDPQCNGRLRILCPFCGEFLTGANLPDIQQLKKDLQVCLSDIISNINIYSYRNEQEMIVSKIIQVFVHASVEHSIGLFYDDQILVTIVIITK